jgi:hypothetical protein
MELASRLITFSAAVFAFVGLAYLFAPGQMLAVVGISSKPEGDFLIRTEGVALASAAVFLWAARRGTAFQKRLALGGLALYYIVGSVVDLMALGSGIVGPASVPSGAIRIALGVVCLVAIRLSDRT